MYHLQSVLFSEDVSSDDDIDRLFSQIEQIEPPVSLIDSILTSVTRLAQQQHQGSNAMWAQVYGIIAYSEDKDPS